MKKLVTVVAALVLVAGIGSISFAYESDFDDIYKADRNLPMWKLGRGIVNLFGLPHELLTNMANEAIKGGRHGAYDGGFPGYVAGTANGIFAGMAIGIRKGLQRMTTGGLEIMTFWKPEYGPTLDPIYGTRAMQFGKVDYFDPEPFWDYGPMN